MKTWLFIAFSCFFVSVAFAQDEVPPFKKNRSLPDFELELTDKTLFTKAKMQKNMPSILMFFSPGCDHCIIQTEGMLKRMKDLNKYQILLVTIQPIEELQAFDKKYQIKKYPNIVTGRDTRYVFPPFYEIQNFPYLAFYDNQGKLLSTFEGNMSVDDMLKKFR